MRRLIFLKTKIRTIPLPEAAQALRVHHGLGDAKEDGEVMVHRFYCPSGTTIELRAAREFTDEEFFEADRHHYDEVMRHKAGCEVCR